MVEVAEIIKKAEGVVERANDLRALELLGIGPGNPGAIPGFTSDWVNEMGDSGAQAWSRWDQNNDLSASGIDASRYGNEFDWIVPHFKTMSLDEGGANIYVDYEVVLGQLKEASLALGPDDEQYVESPMVKSIADLQEGWTGSFPVAFREKFANKLQYITPAQKRVIQELGAALKGHWNIVQGARESLFSIADATEKKLIKTIQDDYAGSYEGSQDGPNGAIGLAIFGCAIAILAIPAAGPAGSVGFTLAILNAVKGAGDVWLASQSTIEVPDAVEKEPVEITGSTVEEIIGSMNDKITELAQKVTGEESGHADAIQASITSIEECMARDDQTASYKDNPAEDPSGKLVPHRLAWADEQPELGSDQFDHTSY